MQSLCARILLAVIAAPLSGYPGPRGSLQRRSEWSIANEPCGLLALVVLVFLEMVSGKAFIWGVMPRKGGLWCEGKV